MYNEFKGFRTIILLTVSFRYKTDFWIKNIYRHFLRKNFCDYCGNDKMAECFVKVYDISIFLEFYRQLF